MKYYFTVPIYYTNGAPHIGHTYTTLVADVIKRYQKLIGNQPEYTTGTDEHGVNVERAANKLGKSPQEFVDTIADEFRMHWDKLGIQADHFIRTSSPEHQKTVQWMFEQCRANGYVYKGHYTGAYCVSDNLFATEAKPGEPCPICGRTLEAVTEENFFFKLSAFTDKLLELYEKHPEFIQPEARRNEVISFVKGGLTDLSITRTGISWGIPVPNEAPHVFYVWFDALIAYFTAAGGADWQSKGLWPADLHLVGKEIIRFHAVYWPAFLMAAGLPLPKQIWAHGWLLFDNDKMSKTKGNVVRPLPIAEIMGFDALRLYLMREVVFGADGNFGYEALVTRYNADLANGIGNLASRTLSMIHQYRGGKIPASDGDQHFAQLATETVEYVLEAFSKFEFNKGLDRVWALISATDKLIVERAPWKLVKDPDSAELLDRTLYTAAEVVRITCGLLAPVMPDSIQKLWHQLGCPSEVDQLRAAELHWGKLPAGQELRPVQPVFPRLDVKLTMEKLIEGELAERKRQDILLGREVKEEKPALDLAPEITIDDFVKVDLRVGQVLEAAAVKGSDKLLHLKVDIGEPEPRSIVAGIALAYKPEQMIGRKVVIVANLAPRKLRGLTSQGMIVAASIGEGLPVLAGFNEDIGVGARLK
ncbi:methionine--tRNA ligase [Bryobacterales bacterium F-183]|nr:methionine--tRNA ligase [Bryobacterales bacterium F-183]